jgi:hypothetical protein
VGVESAALACLRRSLIMYVITSADSESILLQVLTFRASSVNLKRLEKPYQGWNTIFRAHRSPHIHAYTHRKVMTARGNCDLIER